MRKSKYNLYFMLWPIRRLINKIGAIFWQKIVAIIERLQDASQTIQKLLIDARAKMVFRLIICQIKRQDWVDDSLFYEVYNKFVEMKRQSMLKEVNRINDAFMEERRERMDAKLPYKGLAPEIQMKLAVLETYCAYLHNDDAFKRRAFELFLTKKKEETADEACREQINDFLDSIRKDFNYEAYKHYTPVRTIIECPRLWIDFFEGGTGYSDILPREWPNVAYFSVDNDISRFVFDKPYDIEYNEEEFRRKFIQEWDVTHYNPRYDYDRDDDPTYQADYDNELAYNPLNAYNFYLHAVGRFKEIQQALNKKIGGE